MAVDAAGRADYKPAIEEMGLAGNYEHGTHVAGIALAGNPYARLVVARIEYGYTLKPDPCPSREQSARDAKPTGDASSSSQAKACASST